ncbi:flavoprotein [Methanosarcina horonobensis]|uniref:flavoprotein n=1 Tax=Methanosarcina horonobensis TaxID=418008 RepID=UPI000ABD4FAE|nr:flavoprotein [Methanosarcina horonobensis]
MSFQIIAWGITGAGHFLNRSYQVFKELKRRNPELSVNTYISRAAEEVLRMYGLEQKLVKISGGDYLEEIFRETEQGSSSPKVGRFLLDRYDALFVTPATSNTVSKIAYGIADSLVTNAVAQAVKGRSRSISFLWILKARSYLKCPTILTGNNAGTVKPAPRGKTALTAQSLKKTASQTR